MFTCFYVSVKTVSVCMYIMTLSEPAWCFLPSKNKVRCAGFVEERKMTKSKRGIRFVHQVSESACKTGSHMHTSTHAWLLK